MVFNKVKSTTDGDENGLEVSIQNYASDISPKRVEVIIKMYIIDYLLK